MKDLQFLTYELPRFETKKNKQTALLHLQTTSCPAKAPESWIPSQDKKTVILNPVTRRRNSSAGSSTAAKRGYDTESLAWPQPHPSSPFPLLHLCGRVGIRFSHTGGREKRPRTTAETRIWWWRWWYVGY